MCTLGKASVGFDIGYDSLWDRRLEWYNDQLRHAMPLRNLDHHKNHAI